MRPTPSLLTSRRPRSKSGPKAAWRLVVFALLGTTALALAQEPTPVEPPNASERRARAYAEGPSFAITVGQIEDAANTQPLFTRTAFRRKANLRKLANDLVDFELLAAEARKRGLHRNPVVQRTTDERAIEALIKREVDERITLDSITEEQILAYFEAHETELHQPAYVRASHILVATKAEAEALRKSLEGVPPQAFREAAKAKSLDPETNLRGGDLRFFTAEGRKRDTHDSTIDGAIAEAAFSLDEIGDLSAPIAVGERFSVVRLTGRVPAKEPSVEEVAGEIRNTIWRERRREAIGELLEKIRLRVKPTVRLEGADAITLEPVRELPGMPHSGRAAPPTGRPPDPDLSGAEGESDDPSPIDPAGESPTSP